MSDKTTEDGLHCIYGKCQANLRSYPPVMCSPGCYFQGSATDPFEATRAWLRKINDE